jgi:Ca2+-binding RTX toxin-like protein
MALINGTNGNENLNGTLASDTLNGLGGNDTLFGGFFGEDVLDGGGGLFAEDVLDGGLGIDTATYQGFNNNINASLETNKATFFRGSATFISIENLISGNNADVLTGNSENNRLDGRSGSDDISGRAGNDTLIGGSGFDTLKGELGDDSLIGGDDADLLDGGDGADFLAGEKGDDTMLGGSGNDRFQWVDGDGSDRIGGGDGIDELIFNGSATQDDGISLSQSDSDIVLQRNNLVPTTLTIQGIERFNAINGGGGNDVLTVSDLGVASGIEFIKFTGGDGDDLLLARNPIADNPIANEETVSVNFDASGGNGNDLLLSRNGNDTLSGDRGNDTISGGNGNDRIIGAESTNRGRGEIDELIGDAGRDTFVLDNFYDDGDIVFEGGAIDFLNRIDGLSDFARIVDFKVGEDLIQLSGPRSSYELKPITNSLRGGSAAQDMGIFKKTAFAPSQFIASFLPLELIAIVQDAPSGLNINDAAQFKFS